MSQAVNLRAVEPEPGPAVDAALLPDLTAWQERFVELPTAHHALVQSTFVVHTWTFRVAYVTPYMYIFSKDPGTGKTRNMDTLGTVVRNPDSGTDSPVHVLGQEIAASCPTLFFDEMDTTFGGRSNNPLKRLLNIGYQRGAVIKRQRANEVELWPVFCPKVLAGIRNNHLPASLLSRCIPIEMGKRTRELERFNKFHLARDPQRLELCDRMATFAEDFSVDVASQRPEPLRALNDRENEICEPLLQIATVLGQEPQLRAALVRVFRGDGGEASREQVLLTRIRRVFDAAGDDLVFTEELMMALGPYYTARTLGILLAEMGFQRAHPETFRIGNEVKRGYSREDFQPMFDRYLDPEPELEVIEGGES